jgi:DNA-binding LacI/PurR family transcriptional regulator
MWLLLWGGSSTTVSLVINNKGNISEATRLRVERVIDELNYTLSQAVRNLHNRAFVQTLTQYLTVFSIGLCQTLRRVKQVLIKAQLMIRDSSRI